MIENGLFFCYYYFNRHITKGGCFIHLFKKNILKIEKIKLSKKLSYRKKKST